MSFSTFPHALRRLAGAACLALTATAAVALAGGTATVHAGTADLAFNRNLRCSPLHLETGVFNFGDTPEQAKVVVHTSTTMHVTSVFTVAAGGVVNISYPVQVGEIIDTIEFFDGIGTSLYTMYPNVMVTAGDPCEVPVQHDVNVTGYDLVCVGGTLHATMTVNNDGSYTEDVQAYGGPVFSSQQQADLAEQHGFLGTTDSFTLSPGTSKVVTVDFVVLDRLRVIVHVAGIGDVFLDGPRSLTGGEAACQHDESIITGSSPASDPSTTQAPPSEVPTTDVATTIVPTTEVAGATGSTAVAAASGALPQTGGASLPLSAVAGATLLVGGLLVRTTRRRVS